MWKNATRVEKVDAGSNWAPPLGTKIHGITLVCEKDAGAVECAVEVYDGASTAFADLIEEIRALSLSTARVTKRAAFDPPIGNNVDSTIKGVTVKVTGYTAITFDFATSDVDITDDDITESAHGLIAGQSVTLTTTGTLPAGLALATIYFVLVTDDNTFQLEATPGGGAINMTNVGSGTHTLTSLLGAWALVQYD